MKTFFLMIRRVLDATLGTGYSARISTLTAFVIGVSIGQYGPALAIGQVHAASEVNPPRSGAKEAQPPKGKGASKTSAGNKKAKHGKTASASKDKQNQASKSAPQTSKNKAPEKSADAAVKPVDSLNKPVDAQNKSTETRATPASAPGQIAAAPESKAVKSPRGSSDDLARAGDAIALGRNSEAMTLLRKVLAADPLNFDARSSLIALLAERGRNEEWLAELSEAAEVSPERFALTAASAHFEMNRIDDASAILGRIPPTLRDFRHYAFAGVIFTRLQQYAPALSAYDKALALNTGNASKRRALQVARGVALEQLGRKDEARSAYQATIDEGGSAGALSFARTRLANLDLDAVSVDRP